MPKKPAVSVRVETYEKLKAEATKRGIAVTVLLEEIVQNSWDDVVDRHKFRNGEVLDFSHRESFDRPIMVGTPQEHKSRFRFGGNGRG